MVLNRVRQGSREFPTSVGVLIYERVRRESTILHIRRDGPGPGRRVAYTVLITVFFVIVGAVAYLRSPFALVKRVSVSGNTDIASYLLLRDAGIAPGQNLFELPVAKAQNRLLSDFPILQSVSIRRDYLAQSVDIAVRERAIAGTLDASGTLYEVLADGVVLSRISFGAGGNRPIISSGGPLSVSLGSRLTNPALLSICRQLPGLPAELAAQISELHVTTAGGSSMVEAFTRDGFEIQMPVAHLAASLALYDGVHARLISLRVAPGIVDILAGGRAVYKPFPAAGGNQTHG